MTNTNTSNQLFQTVEEILNFMQKAKELGAISCKVGEIEFQLHPQLVQQEVSKANPVTSSTQQTPSEGQKSIMGYDSKKLFWSAR